MTREEAQFILTAYRADGSDALDPQFQEPLQLLATDAALKEWHAREQAMDLLVIEKLGRVELPAGLREQILMGARVSRKPAWFRAVKWMSLAAALLIFSILGSYYFHSVDREKLAGFAADYAAGGIDLQKEANNLGQLTGWLQSRHLPTPRLVPSRLAELKKLGCREVSFKGRSVSIICFQGGSEFHLFVAKRGGLGWSVIEPARTVSTHGHWTTAAWSDAENDYVLATERDRADLERLL